MRSQRHPIGLKGNLSHAPQRRKLYSAAEIRKLIFRVGETSSRSTCCVWHLQARKAADHRYVSEAALAAGLVEGLPIKLPFSPRANMISWAYVAAFPSHFR